MVQFRVNGAKKRSGGVTNWTWPGDQVSARPSSHQQKRDCTQYASHFGNVVYYSEQVDVPAVTAS